MLANFSQTYDKNLELIENRLDKYFSDYAEKYKIVYDAMKYSVKNGGKRLRPILVLEFCKACNGDLSIALPYACAVEMIHTYSLIHDDLPCMDDDDMRRGKPSCHIAFGEEYALLAGDALLTMAFEIVSNSTASFEITLKAVREIATKSGVNGMIGGQVMDLLNEGQKTDVNDLKMIHSLKTGALIECSAALGCIAAGADEAHINAAREYAKNIGLSFQIMDDILDVTGDVDKLGKHVGSDEENQKSTFVSIYGIEKSKNIVLELTEKAKSSLDIYGENANFLRVLADDLSKRDR